MSANATDVSIGIGGAEQRDLVIGQLRGIHTLKGAALRIFDPMLAAVCAERDRPEMAQVRDLLGNMLNAFGEHREQTAEHHRALGVRIRDLGARPIGRLGTSGVGAGAAIRARIGALGGQNHGANARDAFVFEHLEIALLELVERLARRSGDEESAEVARSCLVEDMAMAAKITRNWENVLSLSLASKRIQFERPVPA